MVILLIKSNKDGIIHGSEFGKKTGCGINLLKPNIAVLHTNVGQSEDIIPLTCEKCRTLLAKKIIRSDKKEMNRLIKEEKLKEKKGFVDENIVDLGGIQAKPMSEIIPPKEEPKIPVASIEPEFKEPVQEDVPVAPVSNAFLSKDLEQFALKVEKTSEFESTKEVIEPVVEKVEDDFLAQFALPKTTPVEEVAEPVIEDATDEDFLSQFAIADIEPVEEPVEPVIEDATDEDFLSQFAIADIEPVEEPVEPVIEDATDEDFLSQFAIADIEPVEEPVEPVIEDATDEDFLSQFAIADIEPVEEPVEPVIEDATDEDFLSQFAIADIEEVEEPVEDNNNFIDIVETKKESPETNTRIPAADIFISQITRGITPTKIKDTPEIEKEVIEVKPAKKEDLINDDEWNSLVDSLFNAPAPENTKIEPEQPISNNISAPLLDDIYIEEKKETAQPALEDIYIDKSEETIKDTAEETPVIEDVAEEVPVIEDVAEEVPVIEDVVEETPVIEDVAEKVPIIEDVVEETSVIEDVAEKVPIIEDVVEETPVIEDVVEKVPVIEDVAEEVPVIEDVVEETPVIEDVVEEVPVIEDVAEKVPVIEDVAEEVPVIEDVAEETPVIENVVEEVPVIEEVPAIEDVAEEIPAIEDVAEEVPAIEDVAEEAPVQPIPNTVPVQPIPNTVPVQPTPNTVPVQPIPNTVPVQPTPNTVPVQPNVPVPQFMGYDPNGQPIYQYITPPIIGYAPNGQPIYAPIQMPIGMTNNIQPQQPIAYPAYPNQPIQPQSNTPAPVINPATNIAPNNNADVVIFGNDKKMPESVAKAVAKSTKKNKQNLFDMQDIEMPVIDSIEDALSQMGEKVATKDNDPLSDIGFNEYQAPVKTKSTKPTSKPKVEDTTPKAPLTKKELLAKKKQEKIDAKFKKDLAKRGF